ncbi:MAG: hypothetical protein KZQ83_14890 [gamma proteobacterium symbiont of Taylorina sp.]|nr:hypothetical protein [gamma proteobacterium symbiont of Taylorina sp.]
MKSLVEFLYDIEKYDLDVSDIKNLQVAYSYANGCGSSFKVPTTMWGLNIESACILHDIRWTIAKCWADLVEANQKFKRDLKRIIKLASNWFMTRLRYTRAFLYSSIVKVFGTRSYAKKRDFDLPVFWDVSWW